MLDVRQLRYFVAIFETGAVTKAAATLHVAASALSHHLTNLEAQLETKLFERKPRGMLPTAAGHRLYDHARLILKATETAEADLKLSGYSVGGAVSVGMGYSAAKVIGVDLAKTIIKDLPHVNLAISESLSASTLSRLTRSELDVAIVYNPAPDPTVRIQPILEEKLAILGNKKLIGEKDDDITFDEILDLPLILLNQGISARALMDDGGLLRKIETRAIMRMNSVQTIIGLVEAGLGCAVGPKILMEEQVRRGDIGCRIISGPELKRTLYLCEMVSTPPTFAREAVCRIILDLIEKAVRSGKWQGRFIAV